ncbi:uncharacterized protein [Lolium perenne]|uniref:uncharacterized protein n=1 Tax=Lolium perenne TaxID=4522 RepID=UPI0021F55D93|nr:uncharacterized protein LOC127346067 [Lolium perenne]
MGSQSNRAGVLDEDEWLKLEERKNMLAWIEYMEITMGKYKTPPPMEIVLYPDLMDRAWGWSRLVIYEVADTTVEWPVFMKYLNEYFKRNAGSLFNMSAAARHCLKEEGRYRMIHEKDLSAEDITLSDSIKKRAIHVLNSEVKSVAAASGLMCMAEEARLMSDLRGDHFETISVFSSYIRQSALRLTHYQGSEPDSIAAALLGLVKETISVRNLMNRGNTNISVDELECGFIREATVPLLEKLENHFAREISCTVDEHASSLIRDNTVGGFKADKSEKPTRDSTVVELKPNANEKQKNTNDRGGKNNLGNGKRKRSDK